MNTKDMLKDKSLKTGAFVKETTKFGARVGGATVKGIYNASGSAISTGSNIIVNYGADPYEELQDIAADGTKELASNSIMVARNGLRLGRSTINLNQKRLVRKVWKDNVWNNLDKKKRETLFSEAMMHENINIDDKDDKFIAKIEGKAENKWKANQWKSLQKKERKNEYYNKANIKKGISPISSTNKMIKNQSRKLVNKTANSNDMATGVVGKTSKTVFNTWRYRKQAKKAMRVSVMIVKLVIHSVIAFITSIPVMITTLCTSIIVLLILFIVIIITSFFSSIEYTGRIHEFTKNEVYLEYRYKVNVAPDEVLAITSALEWSTHKLDDYERLFAIMTDGVEANGTISFDKMCDNVFNKFNPANYNFEDNKIEYNTKGSWLGEYKTSKISQSEWHKMWGVYYNGSESTKKSFGSPQHINEMKNKAKESLEQNGKNYIGSYLIDSEYFKERPIKIEDVPYGSASFKQGIRNLLSDVEYHSGTDISVPAGTPLYAVFDADVVWAQKNITTGGLGCQAGTAAECGQWLAGNQVVLKYKTSDREKGEPLYLYVAYYHMQTDSTKVQEGDTVKAGQLIGNVGATGIADGAHLHFQAWVSKNNYSGSNYSFPYAKQINKDNIEIWKNYMDASMFTDLEFRNKLFGR